MSYILQALKKSEEQRQQALAEQESVPLASVKAESASSGQVDSVEIAESMPMQKIALVSFAGLLILALLLLMSSFFKNDKEKQDTILQQQVVDLNQELQKIGKQLEQVVEKEALVTQQNKQMLVSDKAVKPAEEVVVEEVVVPIEQLSLEQTKSLPDIIISSHIYSSHADFRSVVINGVRYKEGEFIAPQVQLAEIKSNAVIIAAQKQKLLVNRHTGWQKL